MAERSFSTASARELLATAPGVYDVEGDRFVIKPSDLGGLVAFDPSGNKVGALMVLAKGRKISELTASDSMLA